MLIKDATQVLPEFKQRRQLQSLQTKIHTKNQWLLQLKKTTPQLQIRIQRSLKTISSLLLQLDNKKVINTHPYIKNSVSDTLQDIFGGLNINRAAIITETEQKILNKMLQQNALAAAADLNFRIMCEIAYQTYHGQSLIFDTLTVNNENYTEVFKKGSTAWRNYILATRRIINKTLGLTKRQQLDNNHRYVAVIEAGSKHGRLHLHVLHFINQHAFTDPNRGKRGGKKRQITELTEAWTKGYTMPIAVRHINDAYKQKGWIWPHDDNGPIQQKSPQAIAGYMSKYIVKSYEDDSRKDHYPWRTKKSQHLGTQIINKVISTLTLQEQVATMMIKTIRPKINNRLIPKSILNKQILQSLKNQPNLSSQSLSLLLKNIEPQQSQLQLLRGSTQKSATSNYQNTMSIMTAITNETAFSSTQIKLSVLEKFNDQTRKYFETETRLNVKGSDPTITI